MLSIDKLKKLKATLAREERLIDRELASLPGKYGFKTTNALSFAIHAAEKRLGIRKK